MNDINSEKDKRQLIDDRFADYLANAKLNMDSSFVLYANTSVLQKLLEKHSIIKFNLLKKNELSISVGLIDNKKTVRSIIENNSQMLGGVTVKDENDSLVVVWPAVTVERRKKAFTLIKVVFNNIVNDMRNVRLSVKKTVDIIKDEHVQKRLLAYLDNAFAQAKNDLAKMLEKYNV